MDAATATTQLTAMLGGTADPALSSDEIAALLASAARADRFGRYPTDAAWEPTYALNMAAAEGWRWKAAKCAGDFGFTVDREMFNRQQVHEHCLAMAAEYAARPEDSTTANSGAYDGYTLGELTQDPYGNPFGFGGVLL